MVWTVFLGTGGKLKYMGQGRIKFIKIHFTFYWRIDVTKIQLLINLLQHYKYKDSN